MARKRASLAGNFACRALLDDGGEQHQRHGQGDQETLSAALSSGVAAAKGPRPWTPEMDRQATIKRHVDADETKPHAAQRSNGKGR